MKDLSKTEKRCLKMKISKYEEENISQNAERERERSWLKEDTVFLKHQERYF